jgi:Zn ribbon nucleic-acid-binding protein
MNKVEIEIVECVSCGETEGNLELVYGDKVFCETCI